MRVISEQEIENRHHRSHIQAKRIGMFLSKPGAEVLHEETDATFRKGP